MRSFSVIFKYCTHTIIMFFIKYNYRCQILDMEAQACTNAKMVLFSREKIPPNATLEIGREKHPFANWFIALFPDTSQEEKYCWWETWDFMITGHMLRKLKISKQINKLNQNPFNRLSFLCSRQIMFECGRGSKLVCIN